MRLPWWGGDEDKAKPNFAKTNLAEHGNHVQMWRKMMSLFILEGTWEEIERHKAELIGRRLRVIVKKEKTAASPVTAAKRPSALGKYAFVTGSSEEFAKEKQAEIEREDRPRR